MQKFIIPTILAILLIASGISAISLFESKILPTGDILSNLVNIDFSIILNNDNYATNHGKKIPVVAGVSNINTPVLPKNLPSPPKAGGVPILMYHHIGYNYDPYETLLPIIKPDNLVVTDANFLIQMTYLYQNNYNTTDVYAVEQMAINKQKIPAKTVVLTFDDSYRDFYYDAFPVLKKYNLHAEVYIITGNIEKPDYLTIDMLKELRDSGLITISSHTVHHISLASAFPDQVKLEIIESKRFIEDNLNIKVNDFCYPSGATSDIAVRTLQASGYTTATTTKGGFWTPGASQYLIPRQRISTGTGLKAYIGLL